MGEKIKIAEFELDNIEALIKSTAEVKAGIDELKEANKQLAKQGDGASEAFIQNAADLKSLNSAYNANIKVLAESNQKMADQEARSKLLNVALNQEVKTINDARASNKLLNKLRNETNATTDKGRKELKLLNAALDSNNKFIKENVDQYTQQKINVGNYTESIKDALGQTTLFGRAQRTLNQILGLGKPIYQALKAEVIGIGSSFKAATASTTGMSTAQKAAAVTSNLLSGALKVLKLALIATGIGAILVLLGSLISYFSKTQRGADFVSKALAVIGTVMDVLIDRVSQFGEALIKFFSGDFSGGFDDMKAALSGVGDEMIREATLAYELEAAFQALEDKQISLISVQAQRKKQIEELRLLAKDEQTDLKERANLLEQAGQLEKDILADQLEVAREQARISKERLALGESSRDEVREDAQLQAEVIELETQSLKLQRSIEAEKQGLLKRARSEEASAFKARQAEAKKLIDLAIKESKTKLDLFIAENKELATTVEEKFRLQEQIRDGRLAILNEELEAGKITQTEAALEEFKIKQEFLDAQSELVVDFAKDELDAYVLANQGRLDENALLTEQLVDQEKERLDLLAEQQRIYQDQRLEQGKISQLEYNQAINEIDEQNRLEKSELDLQLSEQKREAQAIDFQNQYEIDRERLELDYQLNREYLEKERKEAVAQAKEAGADVAKVNQLYDKLQIDRQREVGQNRLDIASNVFGGLVDLLGKESAAGKAAAVAQAVVNVAQGVTKAIADGGLLGIVTGALVAAAGAVSIGKILSTPKPDLPSKGATPKAEKGGLFQIGGNRHSNGGTLFQGEDGTRFEAEKGELIGVMSRKAASHFLAFNGMFGGNSGINRSGFLADGGQVGRSISNGNGVDANLITEVIIDSIGSIPVVNVAQNTYDKAYENARIIENASF
jgi:hypothetical protein